MTELQLKLRLNLPVGSECVFPYGALLRPAIVRRARGTPYTTQYSNGVFIVNTT